MSDSNVSSRYSELRLQIEEQEKALVQMKVQAEKVRQEERAEAIADIRKRIVLLSIELRELFPHGEAKPVPKRLRSANPQPPKFALDGHQWSGFGPKPTWFTDALARGLTEEQLLIRPN